MWCEGRVTRPQGATDTETIPIQTVLRQVQAVTTHSLIRIVGPRVLAAFVPASATRSTPAHYLLNLLQPTLIVLNLRGKTMTATAESGPYQVCMPSIIFTYHPCLFSTDRDKDMNDIPLGISGSGEPMQPPKRPKINRDRYRSTTSQNQHALAKKLLPIDPLAGDKTRGRKD